MEVQIDRANPGAESFKFPNRVIHFYARDWPSK